MLPNDSIVLEYKSSVGESLIYNTSVNTHQRLSEDDQPPQENTSLLEMSMEQKTTEVKDSTADVAMTITGGHITRGDETQELPTVGQTIGITMKRSGEIVKTSVGFPFNQPAFPTKMLKVGDTWKENNNLDVPLNENGAKKTIPLVYDYKLCGFERRGGYETALVEIHCPPTTAEIQAEVTQTIKADGKTYFAYREGRLVESSVNTVTTVKAPGVEIVTEIKLQVGLDTQHSPALGSGFGEESAFIIGM